MGKRGCFCRVSCEPGKLAGLGRRRDGPGLAMESRKKSGTIRVGLINWYRATRSVMARKTVSRMEKRLEAEAAEAAESEAPKKKKKKASKRKKKAAAVARLKLFWGVFSPSMKRVALFDYNQKKQAQKKCDELTAKGKGDHFIQKVKDEITEE